jgi:hypothetical protein
MNKLLIVLIVLIVILVIRFNFKYNDYYEILQVYPSQLTPDILYEKHPVVVYNNSTDTPEQLVDKAMKYMFLYKITQHYEADKKKIHNVKSKYALLYSNEPCEVEIINPKYKSNEDYRSISIKLKKGNLLILPMFWKFKSEYGMECVYIHDLFSCFYHTVRLLF